jgi:hypothetical protein
MLKKVIVLARNSSTSPVVDIGGFPPFSSSGIKKNSLTLKGVRGAYELGSHLYDNYGEYMDINTKLFSPNIDVHIDTCKGINHQEIIINDDLSMNTKITMKLLFSEFDLKGDTYQVRHNIFQELHYGIHGNSSYIELLNIIECYEAEGIDVKIRDELLTQIKSFKEDFIQQFFTHDNVKEMVNPILKLIDTIKNDADTTFAFLSTEKFPLMALHYHLTGEIKDYTFLGHIIYLVYEDHTDISYFNDVNFI